MKKNQWQIVRFAAALAVAAMMNPVAVTQAADPNPAGSVAANPAAATALNAGLSGLNKTIFLDLRDINVVDVIKFLAIEGSLNIVTSKNVQGRSTLLLNNVLIRDALDIIVLSNQLAYDIRTNIIYVMTEEEYLQLYGRNFHDSRQVFTRVLKYAKPSYVLSALQSVQSAIGKIVIDEETGSVVMIDTEEKIVAMNELLDRIETKLDTQVVQLQYANAKELADQLKSKIDAKNVGSIMSDERSNQLIVSAYPDRMKEILPMIQSLDRKTKAVLIDVRILQLTINPKYDYGIDWEKTFTETKEQRWRTLDFRGAFPISSNVASAAALSSVGSSSTTVGKIGWGNLSADELQTEIKFLKQVEKTNLLASPKLMVLDRQEARINIGDRIPYVFTTTTGTGNNVSISENVQFIDVGLILVVTPVINDDGFITVKIRPEVSSRTGNLTTPTNNQIPIVNKTFIESSIVVKDGVTIILGGLRRDELTGASKGIPYLMDIPLVGNLFQSRSESTRKTEIVMFITPKIVTGDRTIAWNDPTLKPSRL